MIALYVAWILLCGWAVAFALLGSRYPQSLKLALGPCLGILTPTLILFLLNMAHIPFSATALWVPWLVAGASAIFFSWSELHYLPRKLAAYFRVLPRTGKFLLLLISLGGISLPIRVAVNPLWPGDGMQMWAKRAMDWYYQRGIHFSPEVKEALKTWHNYPLYHSLSQLVHMVALPAPLMPPLYSANIFDGINMLGILFASLFLMELAGAGPRWRLAGALIISFLPRGLLEGMVSGYAEIDVAYLSFLTFLLLVHFWENDSSKRTALLIGAIGGILAITKGEGIFRFLMVMVSCSFYYRREWRKGWKNLLVAAIPLAAFLILDKGNRPAASQHSPYFSELHYSWGLFWHKIPLALTAVLHSFASTVKGWDKCSWPLTLLLAVLVLLQQGSWRLAHQETSDSGKLIPLLGLIFTLFMAFNILPFLLVNNVVDPRLDDPLHYAGLVLSRLNNQGHLFLSALIALGLPKFLGEKNPLLRYLEDK